MADALGQISIGELKGIGPAQSQKLSRLNLYTLQDLMLHLPHRYEDRTRVTPIVYLAPDHGAVIEGDVVHTQIQFGRRRSLIVTLRDETGQIAIRFFHFSKAQQKSLEHHRRIRCYGVPRRGATGLEFYHPQYTNALEEPLAKTLTPVYPITEGVSQNLLRKIIQQGLKRPDLALGLPSLLPNPDYPDLMDCLKYVHAPPQDADVPRLMTGLDPHQRALALEELTAHQLGLVKLKSQLSQRQAPALVADPALVTALNERLGFQLTQAQHRVIEEINQDLGKATPMLRLVQGDVGSGKTVVAAMAALVALAAGHQVALMAPTEILAEQHNRSFSDWLVPLGFAPVLLTGSMKASLKKQHLADLESGSIRLLIGTHALFQEGVLFERLGLIIIDEQHRFGVNQRMALRDKGRNNQTTPHQLIMTATPIPRTLTMTLYASMDCSVIDELPPGRSPVQTSVLANAKREAVMTRLEAACQMGAQAYWVCTLIEASEVLNAQAAEAVLAELSAALPSIHIALIHGRMSNPEKSAIMARFKAGEIQILVATTVIEVGVDVPNANFMVIENSERLGLTQLHQLRGRVGRGEQQSYCLLLYQPPLGPLSKQRLAVLRDSQDGFYIAEQDLAIRGPGDILGERQSGEIVFKIADLGRDGDLLPTANLLANRIAQSSEATTQALMKRWIGVVERYQQA
ncbi:MAG: ATP-dependent DNA helicase RecG [Candidatus Azotimanducaceae bacterium]|jgi:ATP-dependent DNA helicase RecG|tara:strand:+ start:8547 stop:10607 length:2061 start_codon:yes stop_codon:yes gene_type:complete